MPVRPAQHRLFQAGAILLGKQPCAGQREVARMKNASSQEGRNAGRTVTLVLIGVGCAALAAALILGVNDNPPGLTLVYVAVAAWILAFALRWRRARSFLILLGASLLAFPISVFLHNAFYALAELASARAILSQVLGWLDVLFFLVGVFVCPAGALIGAVGSIVMAFWQWKRGRIFDERP
jgi:hypothetical protein